uniref:Transmembrane protein 230 n=1 Tax=Acrobeloides nanus TaxID=290746 RepID=A0A914ED67_9BILA
MPAHRPISRVRRIPPERLANPNDPYYKCCGCTNLLRAASILNTIGFILDIIVAIMGLIFALAYTDKDAPTIVVALAYPLVTSLGFLGLIIASLKKKYALNHFPFLSLRYDGRNSDNNVELKKDEQGWRKNPI